MAQTMAILAGSGLLPREVARACPGALYVTYSDQVEVPKGRHFAAQFERFGALFDALRQNGVQDVVFAGALSRPTPDPALFDALTQTIWPRFMAALGQGDDGLLREIIAIFEEQGFRVLGPHMAAPGLIATQSMTRGPTPDGQALGDITRGFAVLGALSALDVSQSVVVEGGQVLGIETLQGTDAMLGNVAGIPGALRRGRGVFVKTTKQGQELRIDMPVIGPQTVQAVGDAGLAGVVIEAGQVMILDQAHVFELVDRLGLYLVVR